MDNPRGAANSRLNVTKAALSGVDGISTGLFANNGANGRPADTVEVAMITFDGSIVTSNEWMTTKTAFILNKGEEIYGDVIWLGWDQEGTGTGYTWADTTQTVSVGGNSYTIGTEWTRQFNIAVGLALDKAHAKERNIDLTDTTKYSVNGYYYHDDDGNYYSEGGEGRSGNIMTTQDGKTATVTLKIKRTDTVRIANVPAGTTFTIVETPRDDYDFVSASRGVSGTAVYDLTVSAPQPPSIGGKIVPNKEMNVAFTNQKVVKYHIYILKKDSVSGEVLQGAVFDLYGDDYYVKDGQGQPTATVNTEAAPKLTGFISGEDGKLDLGELASGTYYLVETQAPAGYL